MAENRGSTVRWSPAGFDSSAAGLKMLPAVPGVTTGYIQNGWSYW